MVLNTCQFGLVFHPLSPNESTSVSFRSISSVSVESATNLFVRFDMSLFTSCRKCHRVSRTAICSSCESNFNRKPKNPQYDSEYNRNRAILKRMTRERGLVCWLCGLPFADDLSDWSADHVIKLRDGGTNDLANMQPAHKHCNYTRPKFTRN